jgi:hypothetical protein
MPGPDGAGLKHIMIVDGAENCAYDIFAVTEDDFGLLFPARGQDIAFIDEILLGRPRPLADAALKRLWSRPVEKKNVIGIHGIIFYELKNKKQYYPNRRDSDLSANRSRAQG